MKGQQSLVQSTSLPQKIHLNKKRNEYLYTVIFKEVFFSSSGVSGVIFGGSYFNSKKEFKELFFRSKNHSRY